MKWEGDAGQSCDKCIQNYGTLDQYNKGSEGSRSVNHEEGLDFRVSSTSWKSNRMDAVRGFCQLWAQISSCMSLSGFR
jgi:hypothetical protein